MMKTNLRRTRRIAAGVVISTLAAAAGAEVPGTDGAGIGGTGTDVGRLVAAMLAETPLIDDLRVLTDEIGGRATGSDANRASVEWALERFREAGVEARAEAFTMPGLWFERSVTAKIGGDAAFAPAVVAMPFSAATPPGGLRAPLLDGGAGTEADFERLGEGARGAWVLVDSVLVEDLPTLFASYTEGAKVEARAFEAGVAGLAWVGGRSRNVLYRHNASLGVENRHPLLVVERDAGLRAQRLLRAGRALTLEATIELETGGPYESQNVVAEIRGREKPDETVVLGAHLDSWALGTGALDNGCNVALVIDVARQMRALGLVPRRTIRFVLFNGEEQGLHGSWGYTLTHADELDGHLMASSYDIGSGRITGFFTGGRPEVLAAVEEALAPLAGLGPFQNVDQPIVGTDNYDFMMQGVGNLVANQESANYGPNYHAETDTFDKVDQRQLKLNAAIAAGVTWGFAQTEATWPRHDRAAIQRLIDSTDLGDQMKAFGLWEDWEGKRRGRVD